MFGRHKDENPSYSAWKTRIKWAYLSALGSIGAGLYLLTTSSADANSIFNPLLHGIGIYFIARGVFMGWTAGRQSDQIDLLERIAESLEGPDD